MKLFQISRPQFLVLAFFVLVVFPLILYLLLQRPINDWILLNVEAPTLRKHFGFTASRDPVSTHEFHIATVVPGSLFDRAGFKPGDIPVGYKHGLEVGFYGHLAYAAKGNPVELRVVSPDELSLGPTAWRILKLPPAPDR